MRNCLRLLAIVMVLAVLGSANAATQFSARDGSLLGGPALGTNNVVGDVIEEGFIDITTLPGDGWALINNSSPLGTSSWFQGNSAVFPANNGAPSEYIGANFNNCGAGGDEIISNWLISPEIDLDNVGNFSFYTRGPDTSNYPDRMEIRISTAGASTDVGTGPEDVGDFTEVLDTINESLALGGYPTAWTEFAYTWAAAAVLRCVTTSLVPARSASTPTTSALTISRSTRPVATVVAAECRRPAPGA